MTRALAQLWFLLLVSGVAVRGPWVEKTAAGLWGLYESRYLLAGPAGAAAITLSLPVQQDGLYDVRVMFPQHSGCAFDVPALRAAVFLRLP